MKRLQAIQNQLLQQNLTAVNQNQADQTPQRSKYKLDWFKENGWGYKDTYYSIDKDNDINIAGNRYSLCGQKLKKFRPWAEQNMGLNISVKSKPQTKIPVDPPKIEENFAKEITQVCNEFSYDDNDRVLHSHGHTVEELFWLRYSKIPKCVDAIVYINSHEQAEKVVQLAQKYNVVLIPYGGGTNVTQALVVDKNEQRMVISVDTTRMNHVKWVDRKNKMACVEAGILGQDLERELYRYGVMCGHEPDSIEFSTVGGWVATRASGMKKNRYGNFDDIVINIKCVTPLGTFNKKQEAPRVSSGPDLNYMMLGSEGLFGIITEVVIKVWALPEVTEYDSLIFPSFDDGVQFMYDLGMSKKWPASCRLVDNQQFQIGQAMKPEAASTFQKFIDQAKKIFVTKIKKFDPNVMTAATLVFEGDKEDVIQEKKIVYQLAKKHNGLIGGSENGKAGFFLTYTIAYIRDFALDFKFIAESFETSCAWSNVSNLCKNTKQRILDECKKYNIKSQPIVSFRITHVYDIGAAVYVYFGFIYDGLKEDPVHVYEHLEQSARDEIMKNGGCISHHHGVGKIRQMFLERSIGKTGIEILRKVKKELDPQNIFATQNLFGWLDSNNQYTNKNISKQH